MRTLSLFFFFNDTATTEIYTLSLHDALPILALSFVVTRMPSAVFTSPSSGSCEKMAAWKIGRAQSELQSHVNLVCRLLLEKKKKKKNNNLCGKKKKKKNTKHKAK